MNPLIYCKHANSVRSQVAIKDNMGLRGTLLYYHKRQPRVGKATSRRPIGNAIPIVGPDRIKPHLHFRTGGTVKS